MKPLTTVAWFLFLAAALALIFGIEFERGVVYTTLAGSLSLPRRAPWRD
jgi:hypothetical protein